MNVLNAIVVFILAYLLGSLPSAVWLGKIFHKIDVREHGSGNAGTANVIRVLGWKTGIPVLLIDVAKGWTATMLPVFFKLAEPASSLSTNLQILAGVTAIIGHIFPVFAQFRGGKGVATVFGVLLALKFFLTLSCFGVFLIVLLMTGIISVSSMAAGLAFPILLFSVFDSPSLIFKLFSILVAVALFVTHRKNIRRLIKGEEVRLINWNKKVK